MSRKLKYYEGLNRAMRGIDTVTKEDYNKAEDERVEKAIADKEHVWGKWVLEATASYKTPNRVRSCYVCGHTQRERT